MMMTGAMAFDLELPLGLKHASSAPSLHNARPQDAFSPGASPSAQLVGDLTLALNQWPPRLRPLSGTTGSSTRPTATELFRACNDRRSHSSGGCVGSVGSVTPTVSRGRVSGRRNAPSSHGDGNRLSTSLPLPRTQSSGSSPSRSRPHPLKPVVIEDAWCARPTIARGSSASSSPAATTRPSSPKWFSGSPTAQTDAHNVWSMVNYQTLVRHGRRESLSTATGAASSGMADYLDADGFDRVTENLSTSIVNLQRRLQDFDASTAFDSSQRRDGKRHRQKKTDGGDDSGDEEERRRERFEVYKYKRKIETEVPPLVLGDSGSDPHSKSDFAIMRQNASREKLECCTPTARRDRLERRAREGKARHHEAIMCRDQQSRANMLQYSQDLARKRAQAENALAGRRAGHSRHAMLSLDPVVRAAVAERWFSMLALGCFAKRLGDCCPRQALEVEAKEKPQEEKQRKEASETGEGKEEQQRSKYGSWLLVLMWLFKTRRKVEVRRAKAALVANCLSTWRHSGRFIVLLCKFLTTIKKIQCWWRVTSKQLRQTRDAISRRWERLEHDEIQRELLSDPDSVIAAALGASTQAFSAKSLLAGVPAKAAANTQRGVAAVILEDRIRMDMIDEATRLRFIEHELRARRFMLLPAIDLWREDYQKWYAEKDEWVEMRGALGTFGAQEKAPMFRWAPVQPTYLPGAHPATEAKGQEPCPEHCRGRRGDEDILEMWRVCRENPNGWTQIPIARGAQLVKATQARGVVSRPASPSADSIEQDKPQSPTVALARNQQMEPQPPSKEAGGGVADASANSLFLDVSEEEMAKWGVHAASMPGLQDKPPSFS